MCRKNKKSKTKKKLKAKKYPQKRKIFGKDTIKRLNKILYCQNVINNKKCGKYIPLDSPERQKHHIIPLSKGGTNNIRNILVCCIDCHYSFHKEEFEKNGLTLEKYREQIYEHFYRKTKIRLVSRHSYRRVQYLYNY
ncbi:MAG: HNH endonuclease [Candidatus Helarchaeota archaeon]